MSLFECRKCHGKNFLDRGTLKDEKIDLVCINCGGRTYIDPNSPSGKYIIALENARASVLGISWEVYSLGDEKRT